MNLLFRVIFASACTSTHHKLAIDALRHLTGIRGEKIRNIFLRYYRLYLEGSKAPDKEFKDFRNHVLHVRDNHWGGAPKSAREWYERCLVALELSDWDDVVYSFGVLSHYYTDPIQPFHTAQSQAESNIHRAAEWSIAKSFDAIREIIVQQDGYPEVFVPQGEDWIQKMVIEGAELANPYYEELIERYDFDQGVKHPPSGLDQESREILAKLIGHASVGLARIIEHAFDEANVTPPAVNVSVQGFLASLEIPVNWVTRKLADAGDRRIVRAMYQELQQTGCVNLTLPADDRLVRDLHAKEVLKQPPMTKSLAMSAARPETSAKPLKIERPAASEEPQEMVETEPPVEMEPEREEAQPRRRRNREQRPARQRPSRQDREKSPRQHATDARPPRERKATDRRERAEPAARAPRFYLEPTSDIVDAPSIGPKTAKRLRKIGLETVADLLAVDPEEAAAKIAARHIKPQTIRDWQDQARLMCQIPEIRGHDAQILVACGWRSVDQVATLQPEAALSVVEPFAATTDGQRIIRSGKAPDLDEVSDWISWSQQARPLRAA